MRKLFLLSLALVLVLFSSCENSTSPTGDLTVRIASKKVVPTPITVTSGYLHDYYNHDHISKIEVTITSTFPYGSTGSTITKTATVVNGAVEFKDLAIGNYKIVGKAYNCDNSLIASGENTINIKQNQNTAILDINKLEGSGEFGFRINYEYYGVPEEQLDIQIAITDSNGTPIDPKNYTVITAPGIEKGVKGTLPSGNYIFTVKVYVAGTLVDGYIQTFRTCPGYLAGARFNINGRPATNSTSAITVTNSTSHRMDCYVKKGTTVGNQITLTTLIKELPDGITEKDLTYQWYKNAEPITGATNSTLEVTKDTSYVQYSVIVKSTKIGSWTSDYTYI